MEQIFAGFKRLVFPVVFFLLGTTSLFGQATVAVNTTTHQTLPQTQVIVSFTAGGAPLATGLALTGTPAQQNAKWTVRIDPDGAGALPSVIVPVTSVVVGGLIVQVTFDASAMPTHGAGRPFIMPGETMTIAYAGGVTAGSIQVLPFSGGNFVPVIAARPSVNNSIFNCGNDLIFFNQGDFATVDQCSPVVMNFHQFQYKLSLRFRNSSTFVLANFVSNITWGDATTLNGAPFYVSDLPGNASPAFIDNAGFTGANPAIVVTQRPLHNYPAANPGDCSFNMSLLPLYNGVSFCPGLTQTNIFKTYDTDNANSGALAIPFNPPGAGETTDRVCIGNNVNMRFTDATLLNCRVAIEPTVPNDQTRNIRIVYGSTNYGAPGNIPDIRVTVPAVLGGATTVMTSNVAGGGVLLNPGNPAIGIPVGGFAPISVGTADGNGVVTLNSPVTVATALTYMGRITTTLANNQAVGQRFYIRMDYWDVCNIYNSLTPLVPAPVSITNYVEIVTQPVPLTTAGLSVCFAAATVATNFTVGGVAAGVTAIRFYNRNPRGVVLPITVMQSTLSPNFSTNNYTAANNAVGAPYSTNNANGKYFSVWATQVVGGVNGCESDPIEVVIYQQPDLSGNVPANPTGLTPVCNGPPGNAQAYNEATAPPVKTIPITTATNAAAIPLLTENLWSIGFGAGVTFLPITGNATTVTYNIAAQPNPSVTANVSVRLRYQAAFVPVVSPNPAPNNVPSYNIATQVCQSNNANLSVTVFGQTAGGAVAPNATVCLGSTTGVMTLAGHRGTIVRWERQVNAGPFVNIGNAGLTTFSEVTASGTGTYNYRAVIQNGPCAIVNSGVAIITVNPVPPQPLLTLGVGSTGGFTICDDGVQQVVLQATSAGAVRFDFYKGAALVQTGPGSTFTVNNVPEAGTYTVQVFGVAPSNCTPLPSLPRVVAVNPLPTAANPTGGGAVCGGNPAPDIDWVLTGTAPFNVTYTMTPGGPVSLAEPTNIFTINNPTPAVNTTYQITSLTDANGCAGVSLGGAASVTIGGTAPTFDTAPSLSPAATCDNGGATTDPTLLFSLDPASANLVGVLLTYKVDGSANRTKNFNTNAAGDPSVPITFNDAELNLVAPSPHTLMVVSIITPAGCLSVFNIPLSFTVNPLPVLVNGQVKTICSGAAVNYEVLLVPANTPAGTRFNWPLPTMSAGPAQGTTGVNVTADPVGKLHITDVLTNTTGAAITATYNITPTSAAGCAGTLRTVVVTVNPEPVLVVGQATTICSGQSANYEILLSPVNLPAGTVFNWPAPVMSAGPAQGTAGVNVAMGVAGTKHILDGLTNTTGAPITATYTITPSSGAGCNGTARTVVVTINPAPALVAGQVTTICSGQSANYEILLSPLSLPAGTVFNWAAPVMSAGPAQGTAGVNVPMGVAGTKHINDVLTNTTGAAITATYTIIPTSGALCIGTPRTVVVTVNAAPNLVAGQTTSICNNTAVNYEILLTPANLPAGTVFNWPLPTMSAGGAQGSVGVNKPMGAAGTLHITDVLVNNGAAPITATYNITPSSTLTGCVGALRTVVVTINPTPVANPIVGQSTVCQGPSIILYQVSPTAGSTYSWTIDPSFAIFGGGGTNSPNFFVLLQFSTAGPPLNISVIEKNSFGCSGAPNVFPITVAAAPSPLVVTGPTEVCQFDTGIRTYSVPLNAGSTYAWVVPAGASIVGPSTGVGLNSVTVNFGTISPITIAVSETNASGCSGLPNSIIVNVNPKPTMTSSSTSTVCSGGTPGLNFTATVGSTFAWTVTSVTGAISGTAVGNSGSGNLGLTFTGAAALRNTSGAVGSVSFDVTPTGTAVPNCPGTVQSVVLSVNPEPVLGSAQTKTVCSNAAVNYEILLSPLNLPAGTIFNWPAPAMSAGPAQGTGGVNVPAGAAGTLHILDVLTNTTNSPITATYTITPTSGAGCLGTAKTVVITVNPEPIVSSALDATRCSDVSIGLTLATAAGSIAANNYNITARAFAAGLTPAGTNALVPANGVAANYLANDTYNNLTTSSLLATYTVVPVSAAGCTGAPKIITLTINPEPVLSNALDVTVCSGLPSGLNLNTIVSSVGAANYNVVGKTVAAGLVAGGSNAAIPANSVAPNYLANDTYTNTGNTSLTVVYQVVAVSASGCPGNPPIPITATILPEPVVSSSLNASVCSLSPIGLVLNTNGTSVAAGNYNITSRTPDPGLIPGANVAVPAVGVVAGYLSADVFTNTGNSPLNVTYTVVPRSAVGCFGAPKVITITINPEPVMSNALDRTVCSDVGIGLLLNTNGASVAAANYNITARSISAGLAANGANAAVTANGVAANYLAADQFTNLGAVPLTVTYTVVPVSGGGCPGSPKVITITINPEPVVSNALNGTVCSNVVIGLTLNTNGTSVAATTYNITNRTMAAGLTAGGGNAVVPNNGVAAAYLASDIYSNTGAASLTVTYTVVPISAAGCLGDPKVVTLTVTPEPVMSNALDATVCSNVATGLTLNTNGVSIGAANYNITNRVISAGLAPAGTNAVVPFNNVAANYLDNDKFTNTGASPLTVTYTVVPLSASGCPGPPKAIIITVNPEPVVSNTLDATVCSDIATGLTLATNGASVAAASYNITARAIAAGLTPAAGNASVPAPGVAANFLAADAFTNTGPSPLTVTYTVVPVSAAGCTGAAKVVTITINPEPVVSGTLNTTVCSTVNIGLTLATNGISVGAASYNITARSIAAGLTAGGGNAAVPFNGVAAAYLANDNYTNTGAAALNVTYTVVPVSGVGCLGDPKVITVAINPEPVVSTTLDATICSDVATGLTLNTTGTSVAAVNYNITAMSMAAGLTAAGTNVVVPAIGAPANYLINDKFTNPGALPLAVTYTAVPISAAGCVGAPKIITITVNPEPVASGSLNTNICSDVATGLTLATNGTSVVAANYNITARTIAAGLIPAAGNAVVSANGVAANYLVGDRFTNTGAISLAVTYTVVPVSAAGCLGDPKVVTITIDPEPVVSSTLDASVCSDIAIGLTLNTSGTSVAAANYNITSRIPAAGLVAGPNVAVPALGVAANYLAGDKFTNTGAASLTVAYTVVPVSAGGCLGDPKVITITINPEPVVSATLNATVCSDAAIGLVLNTNGTSVAASTYNVTLRTIAAGLTAAGTNAVVPAVSVAAGYLGGDKFTNNSATPLAVSYTVVPISAAGCVGDPAVIMMTIDAEPALSTSLDAVICSDVAIGLTLATNGTSIAAANYNITARSIAAGLIPSGANAVVSATGVAANYLAGDIFTNTGAVPLTVTYTVVPVSVTGCLGDPKVITITIDPEPVVSNTLDKSVCSAANIGLTLATNGTSVGAATYNITARSIAAGLTAGGGNAAVPFNGVAAAYLVNDAYTNTGAAVALNVTYTVVPVSALGCVGDPKVITIAINPEPVVSNTLDATTCSDVSIGLTLNTTGTSVAAANYNITAISMAAGLTAAGANVVVPAAGVAANYLINDKFTNPGAVTLAVTYTVVPVSAAGCTGVPKVITITISPEPVVSGSLNTNICSDVATGLTLATNGTSVAAANYNVTARTIAAGLTPAAGNVVVGVTGVAANYLAGDKFTNTGAVSLAVTYTVVPVSAAGCLGDPKVVTITIDPEPVVSGTLDASVCSGANIGLTLATNGTSIGAATYNITARSIAAGLTAGGGNAAVPFNGVAAAYLANDVYTNTGAAVALNVTYTVVPVSAIGCVGDPKVITIAINPEPVVSNTLDATTCSDVAIGLTLNTAGTSVAAANYNITARSISVGLTAAATNVAVPAAGVAANYLINDKFTNPGAATLAVTYTVVPISAGGCQGAPKVITITVNPEPVVSTTLNANACSDVAIGLTLATDGISVAAANYNITARTIAAGLTPSAGNVPVSVSGVAANYLAGDKFTNTGAVSLAVTYTVVPVSAAGCLGDPKVITITIDPEPVVSSTLDASVCSGANIGLTLATNGTSIGAATYNITALSIAAGLTAGGGNAAIPFNGVAAAYLANDVYTNTGAAVALNVTYTVVPVSAAGCLGDPKVITIAINPQPVVSNTLDATTCSDVAIGLTLNTTGTSVAAANYNITAMSIAAGLTAAGTNVVVPAISVAANYLINDKFTNPGAVTLAVTYTVVPISAGGCTGVPKVITITISPEPVVSGSLNTNICSDVATGLTLATNGTSVAAANYNVTARTIAAGLTPAAGNVVVGVSGVAANYLAGDKFTNTGAVSLAVTYTVVPVSAAGCLGDPKVVTITIDPEPVVSSTLDASVCSGANIGLTLATNGTSIGAATYNITALSIAAGLTAGGGNAAIPFNGVAAAYLANDVYTNTGAAVALIVTYTVVPVSAAGCLGDPKVITIAINPQPVVSNTLDATTCSDVAIGLTLNTTGTSVAAASYNITAMSIAAGLTAAGTNVVVPAAGVAANYLINDKFTNPGAVTLAVTYTVVPISAGGCVGAPKVITITVNPEPVVSSSLNTNVCSDVATGLTLATNGTSVAAVNYNVTARTIAAGLTPSAGNVVVGVSGVAANYLAGDKFTNTGAVSLAVTYTVVPVSAAGCLGDPKVITITIDPEPVVSSTLDKSVCSNLAIALTLNTSGTSVAAANYNITSRVLAGGLVVGGSNAAVPALGVAANYLASDTYTNTGAASLTVTYTAVPVSAAGCPGDPKVITITINPEPVVSVTLDATVCSDAIIGLTLATDGVSVAAVNYNITAQSISAGLTAAATNVGVPATGVGVAYLNGDKFNNLTAAPLTVTYTVVPVSAGGCLGAPKVVVMTISPEPVLSGSLNLTQCSDVATALTLNTNGTSVAAQNYNITNLTLAGGLTAAAGNAIVPAAGVNLGYLANDKFTNTGAVALTATYTVVPVSAAGCVGDPVNVTVTIDPEPVVSTTLNSIKCSGIAIGLTLNTNGISVPALNYTITARAIPGALIAGGANAAVPAIGVVPAYLVNDVYTNTTAAPLDVTYTVIPVSAGGCSGDAKIITITINPEPVVANGLDATICSDNAIALTLNTNGSSVSAATYNITSRTIDPALTPAGTNATVPSNGVLANYLAADRFTNTGATSKNVSYTVVPVSAAGCTGAIKTITFIINPEPVTANGLDAFICSDASVLLTLNTNGSSVAAASYNIVSRTVAVGLVANGANVLVPAAAVAANYLLNDSFTNTTPSALTVTYVVVPVSGAGCLGDPKTITMTIRPEPVIANGLDGTRCSGNATGLILNTNGSSVAAASYNVTVINVAPGLTPAGGNVGIANGVAANYLAGDRFTNTGALSLNVVYTVVPVSGSGCSGDPKNITFTIDPEPVVSATLNATVCSDVATGLTLNTNGTSVAAASYNITSVVKAPSLTAALGNAVFPANGVAANYLAADAFTNTTNASATVVYNVVAVSGGGCVGAARAITITINPEPVLANGLNKTVCSGAAGGITLNTNGTSVAAANYNITAVTVPVGLTVVSAAAVPAVGVAVNYLATDAYNNLGNVPLDVLYTVVPVSAAGCLGDPLVIRQTVNPAPVLGNLNKTVCSDAAIALTLNTNGTSVAAANYNVTLVSFPAGLTAAGTNAPIPGVGVSATYLSNDLFTNLGNLPLDVQYTVAPISAIGCTGVPVVVVITINPEPVVSNALNKTVCSDIASGITLNTNGTSVAAANYNITSILVAGGLTPKAGNAIVATGVVPAYLAADVFTNQTNGSLTVTYTVVPVSATGCLGNPLDVVLTVDPEPVMDPALATKTICSRDLTNITLNTNGSSIAAATYTISLASQDAGLTGVPTTGAGLLATAILNDNFINVTTIPLKIVYQIVPVSAGNCLGDPFTITITVNAEPVVNPALNNTVCSRDISGIILSTNGTSVAANSYRLVSVVVPGTITADPANTLPGSTSGINLIKNDKYSNTTAAAVVVTYSVFGISPQNCNGQAQSILLTVNPEPILTPGAANLCSDVPSGIILNPAAGSAPITQYQLKSVAKAAALVAGPTNAGLGTYNTNNFLAGDQFTNTTSGPLVVTYTIAPIAIGCTGTDQTVVFTVNPAPGVASNLNRTVCTNGASGIVFATETSPMSTLAASYNITAVVIQAGLAQTAGNTGVRNGVTANEIQNDQFQNPTNNPLTVTYSVKGVSGPGCLGPVKDIVLTIEPTIKATPVNNKPNICSNDITDIDLISPTIPTSGAITFNYTAVSSVGGLISGFVPSASNLPANSKITDNLVNNSASPATVTYTITPVANGARNGSGCSGASVPVVVIVEPKPKMVASPLISSACEGSPTAIVLTTTTVPTAGTIHFNFVSAVVTGGLTLTSAAPPAFYLHGQSITDVWNNPTTTLQTVTYTLLPVVSGGLGCVGDNVTIIVNVNPLPTLTNSPQAPICSNDFINITLTSDVANTINTWTAAVTSGTVTGSGPGAGDLIFQTLRNSGTTPATVRYTVTPKASNCFGTPLIIDVIVNPLADASSVPATQKVCYGGTLNVPLTSPVAGTTFSWVVDSNTMGVPLAGSGPVINQVLFNSTGAQDFLTYTITAMGPGATACSGQSRVMTVIAAPQMNAQFLNPATFLCKGSKDFLQIQLDGQAPFELVYTDGTSNFTLTNVGNFKSIQVQPNVTTTYALVSMKDKLQNGIQCSFAPASQVTFTVGETDATFAIVGPASSCSPYQVSLQYNQKAGTEYTWRWGDGVADSVYIAAADAPGVIVKHTYTNTSPTSTLKPKIVLQTDLPAPFPGCFKSTTQTVNVYPTIITNVFPDKDVICSGELVRFTNQSFGVSATGSRWFYRVQGNVGQELDVQTTKNVSYTLTNTTATNPIVYEVVYQATNGNCPAPDVITPITVYRAITASFNYAPQGVNLPVMIGGHSLVTFTNTSVPIDPTQFRYDWDFALDATPATAIGVGPFPVDFTSPGPRDVVITATNIAAEAAGLSCSSQFTLSINILLPPILAAFKAIPLASCYPSQITVTENTSTGDIMEWRLIDNNGKLAATSNANLPVFQVNAPGRYTLSLKSSNSLTGQVAVAPIQTFIIYDTPLASFDVRPDIVYVPDTELSTFNFSFGATSYFWDFGDNGTSTEFDPVYTYKIEGKYDITLIATNDHGDGAVCRDTLVHTVIAKQGGLTKVPNAFTPNPNGPSGGVAGNGSFNDVFLPIVKGVEEFNMQIYDRWGNLIFESNSASIGWDGYNNDGKLMPAGVYVYKLTVRLSDDQRSTQIGDITMIR